jgi:3-hydroxyacyl-CoA dehydrogenase / enoyl-CoA hydratase / 3-hydroxybutyryl-CoA epimerase
MPATLTAPMIQREIDDGICILTFDRPESGANIFDATTMKELGEHVSFIENEASLKGLIVISAKKSIFIAGADLATLLRQAATGEMRAFIAEGQRVFNRIATLKIPTCAAIHGACAGGGYEITLACDDRVASNDPSTKIGLPETTLGLVPAWGGATRLPRLIGTEKAAEVILKGKLYSAEEAKQLGLVDEVVAREQLLDAAKAKIAAGKKKPSPSSLPKGEADGAAAGEGQTRRGSQSSGNLAPDRAHEIISKTLGVSIADSLGMELDAIADLGKTESTRNLIRNFFLADKYRKGSSKSSAEKITHAAVIGAGVMGSGIAQWLSSRGVSVILRDVNSEAIDRGLANIEKTYGDAVKRGLMSEDKAKQGRARIIASTAPVEMRDVQIVIEAASEKLEIKKQIFADLSNKTGASAILATNTSALPIGELAATTNSAARVIGLHFFNPVSRMKLVEVVVGKQTAPETTERALAFTRQIGKLPVLVQDSPGFLVNRVLFPYLIDAAQLFQKGVSANEIDDALLKWGMPMGPLRLIDEIGVDITVDIANTLEKAYGERNRAPEILQRMREANLLGRKTGTGFYKYEGKKQAPNEGLEQWRSGVVAEGAEPDPVKGNATDRPGSAPPATTQSELALRLVYLMTNEAARCLEEKVVATPEDADYGMILGTGFAPYRGGPLRFADHFGIAEMVRAGDRHGGKFKPCDLLRQHAEKGTKFYSE